MFQRGAIVFVLLLGRMAGAADEQPFVIQVIDEQTRRGVPLVQLRLTSAATYYTDSQGIVAFDEPGLMDRDLFFHVQSDGYELPADGFGFRGQTLKTRRGAQVTIRLKRTHAAERLYRVTGAGIYRDSVRAGLPVPIREPLLNAQVTGSDSVVNAIYRGQIYWFWGDTNRPRYPLGNFNVPGAVSPLPGDTQLQPQDGIDLTYFTDDMGFAKETAAMPGEGPTWIQGLMVVEDPTAGPTMLAGYMKIRPPLTIYERGLCRWNDERQQFEHLVTFPLDAPAYPTGHPLRIRDEQGEYVYFCTPFPLVRVRAELAAIRDPAQYEALSCLESGSTWPAADREPRAPRLERDAQRRLIYAWRPATAPIGPQEQAQLVRRGDARPEELLLQLRDRDSARPIIAHHGSVQWNAYRGRWIMIFVEHFGSSLLGEIWYAEADTLAGPWVSAVKVATHSNYSFYNPKLHPMFDQEDGRVVFFEGTYTNAFSGNPHATPWYDYNQIMYRLQLGPDEPRVMLPVAYRQDQSGEWHPGVAQGTTDPLAMMESITLMAFDRPHPGTIGVGRSASDSTRLEIIPAESMDQDQPAVGETLFYAWPSAESAPTACVGLYEYELDSGGYRYATRNDVARQGWRLRDGPLGYVWPPPQE